MVLNQRSNDRKHITSSCTCSNCFPPHSAVTKCVNRKLSEACRRAYVSAIKKIKVPCYISIFLKSRSIQMILPIYSNRIASARARLFVRAFRAPLHSRAGKHASSKKKPCWNHAISVIMREWVVLSFSYFISFKQRICAVSL